MKLPLYQIDAFTDRLFAGNPAAVVVLEQWLPDEIMQAIAVENNLSETAFVIPGDPVSALRWLTPKTEVNLCGHATLATASVLFRDYFPDSQCLRFSSRSGELAVTREGTLLRLDFPAQPVHRSSVDEAVVAAMGARPLEVFRGRDPMLVYANGAEVAALQPDFKRLRQLEQGRFLVTAPGDMVDFVSRFFAPGVGIDEDPVTGSAHCSLIPYWAERLGKTRLLARQVSARGGELQCELCGARVGIAGQAVEYLRGEMTCPQ